MKKVPPIEEALLRTTYNETAGGLEFLLEAGALTAAIAEEVQTAAANLGVAFHNNLVDAGGAGQESTFNADTVGRDTADGESGIRAIVMGEEDDALEFLDTFTVAFLDLYMNGDLVAGEQIRDVRINRSFNSSQNICHFYYTLTFSRFLTVSCTEVRESGL